MRTLNDFDFNGKRVLVRVGYDVPLENGKVTDDTRIRESIPTINHLLKSGAKQVVLASHLGRPGGKVVEEFRLTPIAACLEKLLKLKVEKLDDCINVKPKGKVVLLENLRFYAGEEKNDAAFAKKLAGLADIYVNDAFSVSHRANASVAAITKFLPCCAGLSLEKEVKALNQLKNPKRPFVVVLGGVKISDKLNLVKSMLEKADNVLIGGAMMFTFFKAKGLETGKSLVEDSFLRQASALCKNRKLVLPVDAVVTADIKAKSRIRTVSIGRMDRDSIGVDIGPETVKKYKEIIRAAKTVVWNGPLGISEVNEFADGTREIAKAIASSGALTVIGGGNTIEAVNKFHIAGFSHVSAGGGAMLEFLEKETLPGIAALG